MARLDIETLKKIPGIEVTGLARICRVEKKLASNQCEYLLVNLSNLTGAVQALCWPKKYHGDLSLKKDDIVSVAGRTKLLPACQKVVIDLFDAKHVTRIEDNPIAFMQLPAESDQEYVKQLVEIMDSLQIKQLKELLYQLFSHENFTNRFIVGKCSESYHHNEIGGLLRHSVDMAKYVRKHQDMMSEHHIEIGIVAALLHDIVKIKDWYNRPKSEIKAPIVNHNSRTLGMAAGPIDMLEETWPDGAELLRVCLEYPVVKKEYFNKRLHVPTIVSLVWSSDEISASSFKERVVAAGKKPWQKYSKMFEEKFYDYGPPPGIF